MEATVLDRQTDSAAAGREALIAASLPRLEAVRDRTAGTDVERWLNQEHGPGSGRHEALARFIKKAIPKTRTASGTPSPGSHHDREAKGGAVIALFYPPAGRVSYVPPPEAPRSERGRL